MDRCFSSLKSRGDNRAQCSLCSLFQACALEHEGGVSVRCQDLLRYGCESQVDVEAGLGAGFHERQPILLQTAATS